MAAMTKGKMERSKPLTFRMELPLLARLDRFWRKSTYKSRTEAIHALLEQAIRAQEKAA